MTNIEGEPRIPRPSPYVHTRIEDADYTFIYDNTILTEYLSDEEVEASELLVSLGITSYDRMNHVYTKQSWMDRPAWIFSSYRQKMGESGLWLALTHTGFRHEKKLYPTDTEVDAFEMFQSQQLEEELSELE